MSFIYYKKQIVLNRGIRYNSLSLINMFYDILTSVFLEEGKKRNTRFKAFREEEKVLVIQTHVCTDNFVREAICWKQNARQPRCYRVGWSCTLGCPLIISLRTTWARYELVVCQQKRDDGSLVFRMLKYYEKVNVSKEIHHSTARQSRNKLYAKFRKTHTKKFFKT